MTTLAWIHIGIVAVVALVAVLPAGISGPGYTFGVSVPPEQVNNPELGRWRSRYRAGVLAAGLAALIGIWATALTGNVPLIVLVVVAYVVVVACLFALANRAVRQVKSEEAWYANLHQAAAVDTSLSTWTRRYPWPWTLPALAVTVATVVIGVVRYPSLPAVIPAHYAANGTVNRTMSTTPLHAFVPVLVQIALTVLLYACAALAIRSAARVDPADPEGSARQNRILVAVRSRALLCLAAFIDLALSFVATRIWGALPTTNATMVLLVELSLLVGVLGYVAATAVPPRRRARVSTVANGQFVARDEDEHWYLGFIYVNREDATLLVPRRLGVGWTLNLGQPATWAVLGALVVLLVALAALR